MLGGGPRKKWSEMTRGEINATGIAFSVIGGLIVGVSIRELVVRPLGLRTALPVSVIVFIVTGIAMTYVQAIRELRRR